MSYIVRVQFPLLIKWRDRLLDNGQAIVNSFAKNVRGVYNKSNYEYNDISMQNLINLALQVYPFSLNQ